MSQLCHPVIIKPAAATQKGFRGILQGEGHALQYQQTRLHTPFAHCCMGSNLGEPHNPIGGGRTQGLADPLPPLAVLGVCH